MSDVVRCRECHRVLTDPASIARKIGPQCAGLSRVRCGHVVDERQLGLFGALNTEGFSVAQWPFVVASRARWANDPRAVEDCEGCQTFGLCAWHGASPESREQWTKRSAAKRAGKNTKGQPGRADPSCPQP